MDTPRVFISYSWDNESHKTWVRNLVKDLRSNGVDAILDQYEMKAGDNIIYFMEKAIDDTDMVLLILTENYRLKAEERSGGVGYEYTIINAEWYQNQTENTKFIPLLRDKAEKCLPVFLRSYMCIDMSNDENYDLKIEELLRRIFNEPTHQKPEIGKRPNFNKKRKTDIQQYTTDRYKREVHKNNTFAKRATKLLSSSSLNINKPSLGNFQFSTSLLTDFTYVFLFSGFIISTIFVKYFNLDNIITNIFIFSLVLMAGIIHARIFQKIIEGSLTRYTLIISVLSAILILCILRLSTFPMEAYNLYLFLSFWVGTILIRRINTLKKEYPKHKISHGNMKVSPAQIRESQRIRTTLMFPVSNKSDELTPINIYMLSDIEFSINIFQMIRQYNTRSDLPHIDTLDKKGNEYEYQFFYKSYNWWSRPKFIDPELTVGRNRIQSKDVITCKRFKQTLK